MIKRILKNLILLLFSNDFFIYFYLLVRRKIKIIVYHGVSNTFLENQSPNVISKEVFEKQLQYLKKIYKNYPATLLFNERKKYRNMRNGITITFDDGYANNYKHALPLLLKYSFKAIFFVTIKYIKISKKKEMPPWWDIINYVMNEKNQRDFFTIFTNNGLTLVPSSDIRSARTEALEKLKNISVDKLDKIVQEIQKRFANEIKEIIFPAFIDWNKLKELHHKGMEIGAHTASHVNIAGLSDDKFQEELANPKHIIETRLNNVVHFFAFPFGEKKNYSYKAAEFLKKAEYKRAFLILNKFDSRINDDFFLNRIPILKNDSFEMFKLKVSGIYDDINTVHRFIKRLL